MALPQDAQPWELEKWGGLNTRAKRPKIGDDEFSWIENYIVLGDGNMRTLYAEGTTLYTAPTGKTIIHHYAFNLVNSDTFIATYFYAVFLSDGSAVQVNILTRAQTVIGSGFWVAGQANLPACVQWQSKYLIIASTITMNGYWIWNGTALFGPGTLSPDITVTDGGSGYTSAPSVSAYGGSGSGATFEAIISDGAVTQVRVINPGSGYELDDQIQLTFTGGGSDNQAVGTVGVDPNSAGVSAVNVITGGSSYGAGATLVFTGGLDSTGTAAQAVITGASNGSITAVTVTHPGDGYISAPTVTVTNAGGGAGATFIADIRGGQVTVPYLTNGGSGYKSAPQVVISPPDLDVSPSLQATAVAAVSGGAVTSITITNQGYSYSKATLQFIGGNNAASATASLMPFGMSGSTLETYQSRIWLGNYTTTSVSAAETVSDFATSDGGDSFPSTDNFLRAQITRYLQSSGFLYGVGDSSIYVISNVQTSGTPPTTTFSNSNVDPQVGTSWPGTVVQFQRALILANPSGVYALYGGAAEKVSYELDALFEKADFSHTPTAAVATIYGVRVFMLSLYTTDPFTGTTRWVLCCWDGKRWFIASQIKNPIYLSTCEINSAITAYASDGTNLFPLFQTPSRSINKVWQSKLRYQPDPIVFQQIDNAYMTVENNAAETETLSASYDTEVGPGVSRSWTVPASALDIITYSPKVDKRSVIGRMVGTTVTTTAEDIVFLQTTLLIGPAATKA